MKRIFWICLLAVPGKLFAQNLDLKDLRWLLETQNMETINSQLKSKGFKTAAAVLEFNTDNNGTYNTWTFRSSENNLDNPVSFLYQSFGSNASRVSYKTTNASFYSHLADQLPAYGFQFVQTITVNNRLQLSFSNGGEEILLVLDNVLHSYEMILKSAVGNKNNPGKKTSDSPSRPATKTKASMKLLKTPRTVRDTVVKQQHTPYLQTNPVNR